MSQVQHFLGPYYHVDVDHALDPSKSSSFPNCAVLQFLLSLLVFRSVFRVAESNVHACLHLHPVSTFVTKCSWKISRPIPNTHLLHFFVTMFCFCCDLICAFQLLDLQSEAVWSQPGSTARSPNISDTFGSTVALLFDHQTPGVFVRRCFECQGVNPDPRPVPLATKTLALSARLRLSSAWGLSWLNTETANSTKTEWTTHACDDFQRRHEYSHSGKRSRFGQCEKSNRGSSAQQVVTANVTFAIDEDFF